VTAVPDKTFIGRIERGFDFLGYHFGPEGLTLAAKTIGQFVARALRLYEQEPGVASSHPRFGRYVRRWVGWASGIRHEGTNSLPQINLTRSREPPDNRSKRADGTHRVG
jgi:hypothetical protein